MTPRSVAPRRTARTVDNMRRLVAGFAGIAALVSLSACSGGAQDSAGGTIAETTPREVEVMIMKDSTVGHFHTPVLEIAAGDTVRWMNMSGHAHNVVFDGDGVADSPIFNDGDDFAATFPETGSFRYSCTLHPQMTGIVEVR